MPQLSADPQLRKRELHLRIARLRRQIDRRARAARREGGRLLSWRTVVRRMPGNAMLAAFGIGLALAAGLSARSTARWLGLRMVRRSFREAQRWIGAELRRVWADSAARPTTRGEDARRE